MNKPVHEILVSVIYVGGDSNLKKICVIGQLSVSVYILITLGIILYYVALLFHIYRQVKSVQNNAYCNTSNTTIHAILYLNNWLS